MKKMLLFLTFISLIFLAGASFLFVYEGTKGKCSEKEFEDEGISLAFIFSCEWDLSLNTNISNEFVFSEETELYGPVAENYDLNFKKDNLEVSFSKFLEAGDGGYGSLDENDEYEILDDKIVRYKLNEKWYYVEYFKCEDIPEAFRNGQEDCMGSFFPEFGKFPTVVSTFDYGEKDLQKIDELVLEVLK